MGSWRESAPGAAAKERKLDPSVLHWKCRGLGRGWGRASKDEVNSHVSFLLVTLGKEIKKSKLIRSHSINNQTFHAKYGNLDKCARYDLSAIHIATFILHLCVCEVFTVL